jgi:hypothetical protein
MDERLLRLLANRAYSVATSPGDVTSIDSLTNPNEAIEIAVIHLHRFAFYYWLRWSTNNWTKSLPIDRPSPDLVTIDYHNDVGAEWNCIVDELSLLVGKLEVENIKDDKSLDDAHRRRTLAESNVAAYSVLGLTPLNDGHILPAQYLNALGDVFVLYDQYEPEEDSITDLHGNQHRIRYFNDPVELVAALRENPHRETYFDLDVDYFFKHDEDVHGEEKMIPARKIRKFMNPQSEPMASILNRNLKGITFALEPTHCGGLPGCFKAMSIVMKTLFEGDLLGGGAELEWR